MEHQDPILAEIRELRKDIHRMSQAIEGLTTAVSELEGAETAAAAEFAVLAEEIKALEAKVAEGGQITEAEVDSLAAKASAVAAALKAATPGAPEA